MKPENAIEVKNIKKSFKVYLDKGNTIKDRIVTKGRAKHETREVLKGISFEVKKGEAIGLIGHNGCGKSTTLKLLTKIMYPDSGSIEMRGRVSSLIELGAGFHPDMSGRENIYINASIFGLTKKEIDRRIDQIIEFSELEEFIDNPVRTYSSGMYMRLAFSVAINVDADILLIDEILAVGDISFQSKCFNRMREIKAMGTTIVIVSHSLNQIEELCERSYWIDEGRIREKGNPREVHRKYMEYMSDYSMKTEKIEKKKTTTKEEILQSKKAEDNKVMQITDVSVYGEDGVPKHNFVTGQAVTIEFGYKVFKSKKDKNSIELVFVRTDGIECYETNTFREGFELMDPRGEGKIKCRIDKLNLITGEYWIEIALRKPDAFPYHYKEKAYKINMTTLDNERGIARLDHTWDFGGIEVGRRTD